MPKWHLIELIGLPPEFQLGSSQSSTIQLPYFFCHCIFSLSIVIVLRHLDYLAWNHHPQNLLPHVSADNLTSNLTQKPEPSERSSQQLATCFQMYNPSTSSPLSFSILIESSFLLPGWDHILPVLQPIPSRITSYKWSRLLSMSSNIMSAWRLCSFNYAQSYLRKSLSFFSPFDGSSIPSLLSSTTFLKRIVYKHCLYFLICHSFHNPLKPSFHLSQPAKLLS